MGFNEYMRTGPLIFRSNQKWKWISGVWETRISGKLYHIWAESLVEGETVFIASKGVGDSASFQREIFFDYRKGLQWVKLMSSRL